MQKKTTIWTYAKRALLVIILVVVVIFVSIYFLDVYKVSANINDYNNEYEDSYWENLEENGFVHFNVFDEEKVSINISYSGKKDNLDDLKNVDKYKTETTYRLPFDESANDIQKLNSARFDVELNYIYYIIIGTENHTDEVTALYEEIKAKFTEEKMTRAKYLSENINKRLVLSNDKYDLYMSMITTEFILVQKDENGEAIREWRSNPTSSKNEYDASTPGIAQYQQSILTITCVDGNKASTKTPIEYNSYANATQDNSDLYINPSFYINVIDSSDGSEPKVLVYYQLSKKGIDATYIPSKISKLRLQELLARCNQMVAQYKAENNGAYKLDSNKQEITEVGMPQELQGICPETGQEYTAKTREFLNMVISTCYKKDLVCPKCNGSLRIDEENDQLYYCEDSNKVKCSETVHDDDLYYKLIKDPSETAINYCYRFLYDWCGYTEEDYLIDVGQERQETSDARVDVAIEYKLGENGLEVMIPGNSIKTNTNDKGDKYLVTDMKLLQYFTSTKANKRKEGYLVIPDGSGAIMEFNNSKANYSQYSKRIYTSDLTFTSYTLTSDTSDILLPMYGYVFTGPKDSDACAMVVEALDGAAQVNLNADTANRGKNTFNYAYYSITFRESQKIVIGTNQYNRNRTTQYTVNGAFSDYKFAYMPLDLTQYECSYNGVAKFYRDLLVSRSKGRLSVDGDKTTTPALDLEVLGSYSYHTNFLGIGYTGKGTLTTVEQLQEIIDEITHLHSGDETGITNINVYYKGWRNTGLTNVSFEKMKVSNLIGGKKSLLNAINEYNENIKIYPHVEFLEYEKYQESFGKSHYTARDIGGEYATKYPYELNSNVFNKKMNQISVLSPGYYDAFSKELSENYYKVLGINTIALSGLGSELSGDYRKKQNIFKSTAVNEQINAFINLEIEGIDDIALESPYAYALEFANNAYNVPYDSTKYEILDYNIPFYQLVINGLMDYSGESINENVEKGLMEHMMRCIETGSNPAFTFTYDDSSELLQTDYNTYYFTLYERWLGDVKTVFDELNAIGIYNARLIRHEKLLNDVYKVTYQPLDGSENIEIVLNYQRVSYSYNGIDVSPKTFKVVA